MLDASRPKSSNIYGSRGFWHVYILLTYTSCRFVAWIARSSEVEFLGIQASPKLRLGDDGHGGPQVLHVFRLFPPHHLRRQPMTFAVDCQGLVGFMAGQSDKTWWRHVKGAVHCCAWGFGGLSWRDTCAELEMFEMNLRGFQLEPWILKMLNRNHRKWRRKTTLATPPRCVFRRKRKLGDSQMGNPHQP